MKNAQFRFMNISPVVLLGLFYLASGFVILFVDPRTRIGMYFAYGPISQELISAVIGLTALILGMAMLIYQQYAARWYAFFSIPSLIYNTVTAGIIGYTHDAPAVTAVVYLALLALGLQNIDIAGDLHSRDEALAAKDAEIKALTEQLGKGK